MNKHTLTVRIEPSLAGQLKKLAKAKGYKSVNKFINNYLNDILEKEKGLPEIFYHPVKVEKQLAFSRDEIYDEHLH